MIGAIAVAALGACLLVDALVRELGGSPAALATSLAYPLGDLLLLALVVGVMARTGWRPDRDWGFIGLGLALFAVADGTYVTLVAQGRAAPVPLGVLWVGFAVLLAAGAWQPAPTRQRELRLEGLRVLVVPLAFAALAVGLLVHGQAADLPVLGVVLATTTLALVGVRTALTFAENLRLLQARRQAVTDELTGLANRRGLTGALDRWVGRGGPVGLLLVDLDRFKELNDTLGHHVGDLLLAELGKVLYDDV